MPVPAGGDETQDPDLLATTADLAAALQIAESDLDQDAALLLLQTATAVVQAITGQRLVEVIDDPFDVAAPTSSTLLLPERPVTAVSSVVLDGTTLSLGTACGTYRLVTNGLWRDTGWATCYGPTRVTGFYSHGWAAGHQKLQLARSAVLSLVKGCYVNPDGVFSEKIDDYSVAYEKTSAAMDASPFLTAALRRQYGRPAGFVALS